jgi:hypothetical protein
MSIASILTKLIYEDNLRRNNPLLDSTISAILVASGIRPGAIVDDFPVEFLNNYLLAIDEYYGCGLMAIEVPSTTRAGGKKYIEYYIVTAKSPFINKLLEGENLTSEETGQLLGYVFDGEGYLKINEPRIVFATTIRTAKSHRKVYYQTEVGLANLSDLVQRREEFEFRAMLMRSLFDDMNLDLEVTTSEEIV